MCSLIQPNSTPTHCLNMKKKKRSPSFLGKEVNTPHVLRVEVSYPRKRLSNLHLFVEVEEEDPNDQKNFDKRVAVDQLNSTR